VHVSGNIQCKIDGKMMGGAAFFKQLECISGEVLETRTFLKEAGIEASTCSAPSGEEIQKE
jgi:hypothetical protein